MEQHNISGEEAGMAPRRLPLRLRESSWSFEGIKKFAALVGPTCRS